MTSLNAIPLYKKLWPTGLQPLFEIHGDQDYPHPNAQVSFKQTAGNTGRTQWT